MQSVIKVIAEHLDVAESKVTPEAHLVPEEVIGPCQERTENFVTWHQVQDLSYI